MKTQTEELLARLPEIETSVTGGRSMIFEALHEAAEKGELILTGCGLLRYHRRRDGQITIREILVLPEYRRKGHGQRMLWSLLQRERSIRCLVARCPIDLESAQHFYAAMGFKSVAYEKRENGRDIRTWRVDLDETDLLSRWKFVRYECGP